MRIFYDPSRDSIFVDGSVTVYPDRSLEALPDVNDANKVGIWIANGGPRVVGPLRFDKVQDISGATFSDAASALVYLNGEFSKKDREQAQDLEPIQFDQTSPSDNWVVAHNLGRKPGSVEVYVGGCLVDAAVINLDLNRLQVCFNVPQTGCVTII